MSGDIFMSQLGKAATGIQWVEARDVLSILPCTGQPPTAQNYRPPNVSSGESAVVHIQSRAGFLTCIQAHPEALGVTWEAKCFSRTFQEILVFSQV